MIVGNVPAIPERNCKKEKLLRPTVSPFFAVRKKIEEPVKHSS